jgi:hypothetical protein
MMPSDVELDEHELFLRRRRRRSIALGLVLAALVILFYVLTFVKMGTYHTL